MKRSKKGFTTIKNPKRKYIVVGDNNYWYATTPEMTSKQALTILKRIAKEINGGMYDDGGESANELYLFEVKEVERLKI